MPLMNYSGTGTSGIPWASFDASTSLPDSFSWPQYATWVIDSSTTTTTNLQLTTATWHIWVDAVGTLVEATRQTGEALIEVGRAMEPSEAMVAARRRSDQERHERLEEQKAAVTAAEEILLEHLDKRQQAEYRRYEHFRVIKGGRIYRIEKGIAGNVYLINKKGRDLESYCIHPTEDVPVQDNMLIQKLMIETDEEAFRKIANITNLRRVAV